MIKVSPTIELDENGFGNINNNVISLLLISVEDFFKRIGVESSKRVRIIYHTEGPMCCATQNIDQHLILLNTGGNQWCQWIYQFAHEYCHHLIDGGLLGGIEGLKWFEESVCHVASYACLDNFERICANNSSLEMNVPGVIVYLRNYLSEGGGALYDLYMPDNLNPLRRELIPQEKIKPLKPYIESRMGVLTKDYSTLDYKTIARGLFPHFYNNENLWRILLYMGDTKSQKSLQNMLDCLLNSADDDYRDSLIRMIMCLT